MKKLQLTPVAIATGMILTVPVTGHGADDQQVAVLDPVVVTATRSAQTVDETLASVSVITRDDIERSQATDLPGLLDREPGMSISRNGPFGKLSSVFTRGTNSGHTLFLVDGMQIGSATAGTAAIEYLPLHDVERVEIVRGPRSSLYGADAIGGVVQLFTRGEERFEGERFRGGMMVGSFGTEELTAGADFGDGNREFSISARKFDTDGIRMHDNSVGPNGFSNDSASMRYRQDVGDHAAWTVNFLHSKGRSEIANTFDPTADEYEDFVQQAVSTSLDIDINTAWDTQVKVGQSKDERETFSDAGVQQSAFDTQRDHATWKNDISIAPDVTLIAGTDAKEDRLDSTTDYDEDSRYNVGAFAVGLWSPGNADFEVSARRDKNEAYGYATTGGTAIGYNLRDDLRVRGSVGTAFKAPTFNDLYFPGFANPDLDPEESISYELGIEGGHDWRWSVTAFQTHIDEMIVFDGTENMPLNVNEAQIDGVELGAATPDLDGWRFRATATWQDPVAKGQDGADDAQLPRRPKRKFTVDADRTFEQASMGFSVRNEGARFEDAANNTELDGFTVMDLRVGYRLTPNLTLRGLVNNAMNAEYQTVSGYHNAPRGFFVRLDYRG